MVLSASIVLYNNDQVEISKNLHCLQKYGINKIFVIDNSFTNILEKYCNVENVIYVHNPSNPGFGAAHNIAIQKAISARSNYHFIVNPDIFFNEDVISPMAEYMKKNNEEVGMVMPKILNLDGSVQHLPKLLPSPWSILLRKFKKPNAVYQNYINQYELRFVVPDKIYNTPILSGCFTLLNLKAIQEVGMYDDNYFMYFEDWDLSRRMHQKYKTIYYPLVAVYHGYESGANKKIKLFKIFIKSAIIYFNKWGWFFDCERKKINKETLSQFK